MRLNKTVKALAIALPMLALAACRQLMTKLQE